MSAIKRAGIFRSVLAAVTAMGLWAVASQTRADVIFQTDFTGTNGTIPANTGFVEGNTSNGSISSNDFRVSTGRVRLVYTGAGADSLTNYTVQSVFRRAGGGGFTGLIARSGTPTTDASVRFVGYTVRLNLNGTAQDFELYRLDPSGAVLLNSQSIASTDLYVSPQVWTIAMTVNGSSITGKLVNASGTTVANVSATDATYATGTGGLRSEAGAASVHQDLTITAVPEPATLGLLGAAAAGVMCRRASR